MKFNKKYEPREKERRCEIINVRVTPKMKKLFLDKAAKAEMTQTRFFETIVTDSCVTANYYARVIAEKLVQIHKKIDQLPDDSCDTVSLHNAVSELVLSIRDKNNELVQIYRKYGE